MWTGNRFALGVTFSILMFFGLFAASPESGQKIAGRWDVTIHAPTGSYPSWFEIRDEGGRLAGRFVGRVGSARPIQTVEFSSNGLRLSLPVQYEKHKSDMVFAGRPKGGKLEGTTNGEDGSTLAWNAVRAPVLAAGEPEWGEPIQLFNGRDLDGWKVRDPKSPNNWKAENGVLANTAGGTDLITKDKFKDFKLHTEFVYPARSNSGVYLRGRYEVQIQDDFGKDPGSLLIGGVYGFITPTSNAGRPADEWQSYDITLTGRRVTVVLNGATIIDNQEIPGITGGALDSNEGEPGPIMLQGDHGKISFRNISLTPVRRFKSGK
ncbi:MAG TPA: DUF1080 domain-containing protein [Acidobacteriota bacterium]|jgi:hypothetical protein